MSAESGIPTFRGDDGIWKKYNPAIYGNIPGLAMVSLIQPLKVVEFGKEVFRTFLSADPNPGHDALAKLEEANKLNAVITQNVDNLHERAGSKRVIKLHGDFYRLRCIKGY